MQPKTLIFLLFLVIISFNLKAQIEQDRFYKSPSSADSLLISKAEYFTKTQINEENAKQYFKLAEAFWNTKKNEQAKTIFLKIMKNDTLPIYNNNLYCSSNLGNHSTKKSYGYGSFSFNYKNKASIYLTKIYIEEQDFEKALQYISLADIKYSVQYTCGTGHHDYTTKLQYLYALSYEGLEQYDKAIKSILPNCFHWKLSFLFIKILKKRYSKAELLEEMNKATKNLKFIPNKTHTTSYITQYAGTEKEITTIERSLSGKAIIQFFGHHIELPEFRLKNGEIATRKKYIRYLKQSNFYRQLTKKESNKIDLLSGIIREW